MRNVSQKLAFGGGNPQKNAKANIRGIHPALFYAMFIGLFATNTLAVLGFLMAPDVARLVNGQNEVAYAAYEDRIVQLRVEVDRLHSRQYAQAGSLNLQIQDLAQQQEILIEQHTYVKALAAKAQELGIETTSVASTDDVDDTLVTGAIAGKYFEPDRAAIRLGNMIDESRMALTALSEAASVSTTTILDELKRLGIKTQIATDRPEAVGGPFQPVPGGNAVSLIDDANAVNSAFERFRVARNIVNQAPIHLPMTERVRVSSKYGTRNDPFLKRKAFHSGVDFAAARGTKVLSAGAGKVIFVGRKGGYGNIVEVEHSDGLITRYAHLLKQLVHEGDIVETGTPIALVGSTGRSTGPHLHFEVRKNDSPINPSRFLNAGDRMARFL